MSANNGIYNINTLSMKHVSGLETEIENITDKLQKHEHDINVLKSETTHLNTLYDNINYCHDKKVIIFMDADKDDLYSLNLLIAQHYVKNINIIGIVCDDGFLDYPQNVIMTNFWVYDILKMYNVDIYKGIHRNLFLKEKRFFPSDFISSFIEVMKKDFNYNPNKKPIYTDIQELINKINKINDNIYVLTTGNLTSLSYIISNIRNTNILKIYSMIGNYKVKGNVINPLNIDIIPNSEYNAYLDPDSFSKTIQLTNVHIVPLDCTNYAPLNDDTITKIIHLGNAYIENTNDKFILDNYGNFVKLLKSTTLTINTKLYMWDSVAALIFLGVDINQKYYKDNIDISWTGEIIKGIHYNNIYNYIDYNAFLENIVKVLFTII